MQVIVEEKKNPEIQTLKRANNKNDELIKVLNERSLDLKTKC